MICHHCSTDTVKRFNERFTECSNCGRMNCQEPEQEGDPCPECAKPTVLHHPGDGCSCHIAPPCGYCVDAYLVCEACGWESEKP